MFFRYFSIIFFIEHAYAIEKEYYLQFLTILRALLSEITDSYLPHEGHLGSKAHMGIVLEPV